MTHFPTTPDIIVVGAGAAGLSSAKALMEQGYEVVVLEAAGHVGGRCVTDQSAFSVPFDRGGSWLHSAPINPLARIAEQRGEDLHKARWDWKWVMTNGTPLGDDDVKAYSRYQETMWEAIKTPDALSPDRSVEATLPPSPYRNTAKQWVAQMQGGNADVVSAKDVQNYDDADGDWLVGGGLGAFVSHVHRDVPVRLNCPVSKIDYSGDGVKITTAEGTLAARYVVLTVSTGVLAAEAIEFVPRLPARKIAAIGQVPNGLLNKVGIEFDPAWTLAQQGDMADYAVQGDEFCTVLFGFFGSPLAVGFLAGRFADEAEREGAGAATDFCLNALREIFGNDVTKHILATSETAWRSNPLTLGSYSYACPGGADARKVLVEPLDERLFFAGEATISTAYATVHGAYLSGVAAAEAVVATDRKTARKQE